MYKYGEYIIDYRKILEFAPQIINRRGNKVYTLNDLMLCKKTKKEYLLRLLPFGESNIYNKELSKIHICRKDVLSNGEIFYFCNEASCGIGESMLEKILVKENNLEIE